MRESVYVAFAASIVRSMLLVAGGWFVSRGLVEDGLMREAVGGLAVITVTQSWAFWRLHRRLIYQKWLVLIGLESEPTTPPEVVKAEAAARVRDGWVP